MATQLPPVHSVHVYDHDLDLISRLGAIVSTGLRVGDGVLVVATEAHRDQVVMQVEKRGVDIRSAVRDGRYVMLDAADTLSAFMRNGLPDAELFQASVGTRLAELRARAKSKNGGATVFGEMVAVLWEKGQKQAALRLEEIWNAALANGTFHLHCAYPRDVLAGEEDLLSVCEVHSHVLQ